VAAGIVALVIAAAGCGSAAGSPGAGHSAASRAKSALADPTASADLAHVEQVFKPCFEPPGGSVPTIRGAVSCAKGKVPAVQDKSARRAIAYHLGTCLLGGYRAAGGWDAFKAGGWQPCAQVAYTAALAAGASPGASPPARPAVTAGSS
jgi:hypothetical protein